jgi:peptidoglycan/LPS O-acetylase OafA/YrhL
MIAAVAYGLYWSPTGGRQLILAIGLSVLVFLITKQKIRSELLEALGKISYPVYLLHFIVLSLIDQTITREPSLGVLFGTIVATILISSALAVPVHYYIEKPVAKLAARLTSSRPPQETH